MRPASTALVLASTVGSFMLSNQMRGRAIRTDPDESAKDREYLASRLCEPASRHRLLSESSFRAQVASCTAGHSDLVRGHSRPCVQTLARMRRSSCGGSGAFEGLSVSDPPYHRNRPGTARLCRAFRGPPMKTWKRLNGATFRPQPAIGPAWCETVVRGVVQNCDPEARLRPMTAVRRASQGWVYRKRRAQPPGMMFVVLGAGRRPDWPPRSGPVHPAGHRPG